MDPLFCRKIFMYNLFGGFKLNGLQLPLQKLPTMIFLQARMAHCQLRLMVIYETPFKRFYSLGKNTDFVKISSSAINKLLFDENDDLYVISKCPLLELYIAQGFLNHLFSDGLVPFVECEKPLLRR